MDKKLMLKLVESGLGWGVGWKGCSQGLTPLLLGMEMDFLKAVWGLAVCMKMLTTGIPQARSSISKQLLRDYKYTKSEKKNVENHINRLVQWLMPVFPAL